MTTAYGTEKKFGELQVGDIVVLEKCDIIFKAKSRTYKGSVSALDLQGYPFALVLSEFSKDDACYGRGDVEVLIGAERGYLNESYHVEYELVE